MESLSLPALAAKSVPYLFMLLMAALPFLAVSQTLPDSTKKPSVSVPPLHPGFPQLPQKKEAKSLLSIAPTEADDEFDYDSEFNYGVNFNTAGGLIGGASLKYAWRDPNSRYYSRVMLELVHIKQPKETRAPADISSYIPDKVNYLFAVRPSYGKERTLFRKGAEEGVQLNVFAAAGPTFGLVKPYYLLYSPDNQDPSAVYSLPYNPATMVRDRIRGVGGLTDGFDQLKLVPGVHVRGGLSFEFGRFRNSVVGIEVGFVSEYYARSIVLLQSGPINNGYKPAQVVNSLYLTLYYGTKD